MCPIPYPRTERIRATDLSHNEVGHYLLDPKPVWNITAITLELYNTSSNVCKYEMLYK